MTQEETRTIKELDGESLWWGFLVGYAMGFIITLITIMLILPYSILFK